jgi:STE24 endopeptidase
MLVVALELLATPGAYCIGFVLERRYGLSRQSLRDWMRDHLKASGLGLLMAVVAALVVYASMAASADYWWLLAGVVLTAIAVAVAVVAPVVLFPLFYRLRPLPEGGVAARLTSLAAKAGSPVLGVYEWALGEKSEAANAALIGLGPTRRILLSDTLIERYTPDEIEVIIAHELAHCVHGDIWKGVLLEAVQGTLALGVAHLALLLWGPFLGVRGTDDLAGMPLLALAAAGWTLLTAPLLLALSRRHERRADRFALELTDKADAFISAMRRLGAQNLADEAPSRLVEWLFHSHPTVSQRIARARHWAAAHPVSDAATA